MSHLIMSHLISAILAWLFAYQVWQNLLLKERVRVLEYLLDLECQRNNKTPTGAEKGEQE